MDTRKTLILGAPLVVLAALIIAGHGSNAPQEVAAPPQATGSATPAPTAVAHAAVAQAPETVAVSEAPPSWTLVTSNDRNIAVDVVRISREACRL